ncbi:MurR/RpiR family transcriptional regulator [Alteribacillus iranensis]|uniref:DNA-binding transcriptional regulator, MurR/RpiR family, contains HTH and SIS domains n=1 Tax=Alteribacillus iranensis TaxID=930128 RepID=A0A1I2CW60_9BACI|nr:MurR/RpiR family transcriptional regulator [Alteribacillus iranensis]SFE72524.1 DNA-binding transcriptional regulator, MurR/RpiR family, contains HTH and SIS domains [Alteribacillus iranensis]
MLESDVLQRIMELQDSMSKSQKKIANYLIKHADTAPFLTASKLAKNAGVGEATVIRFATFLDYKGYPDMQRHLQEALQRKWTSAEVFARTTDKEDRPENAVSEILTDDVQNLKETMQQMDMKEFEGAVKDIVQANRIYIIAYRSAVSVASFLEFYLDLVLQNTELIREADGVSEHLLDITSDDLVIGFGFSRYTKRTVEAIKYAKQQGAKTLVITDHLLSPLVPYGDRKLLAVTEINSFINSFSAPLSIVSALVTAVTRQEHEKVERRLEQLEGLWETFDVFYD